MKNANLLSVLFYFSAAYDGLLGLAFLTCPDYIFNAFSVPPPNHFGYVQFPAALLIIFACIQKGYFIYALAAVIASILTLASFMKVQKFAFLGKMKEKYKNIKEVPFTMKLAMICLAIICIFGGLLLLPSFRFFLDGAVKTVLEGKSYAGIVFDAVLK